MRLEQIANILKGVQGFSNKVAYYCFPEGSAPALPFIVYMETGSDNMAADNVVYYGRKNINVELYTELRDESTEAAVEAALYASGIFWEKEIEHLDSERCYMITYTINV